MSRLKREAQGSTTQSRKERARIEFIHLKTNIDKTDSVTVWFNIHRQKNKNKKEVDVHLIGHASTY